MVNDGTRHLEGQNWRRLHTYVEINQHWVLSIKMSVLIKIEVDDMEDAEYITSHLNTQNPVIDIEFEELEEDWINTPLFPLH